MSAKHDQRVRSRLRQMERDDARLTQLEYMTGTGHGITRIPQRTREGGPVWKIITPHQVIYERVYTYQRMGVDINGTESFDIFNPIGTYLRRRPHTTIIPEQAELLTEVDMNHYRQLCREKRELETKLRKYVVGHSWFIPHISPFGADRFRRFDPTPAADLIKGSKERWCNRISGY